MGFSQTSQCQVVERKYKHILGKIKTKCDACTYMRATRRKSKQNFLIGITNDINYKRNSSFFFHPNQHHHIEKQTSET